MDVAYLLRRAANEHPTSTAVEDAHRRLTISALIARGEALANALDSMGIADGERVFSEGAVANSLLETAGFFFVNSEFRERTGFHINEWMTGSLPLSRMSSAPLVAPDGLSGANDDAGPTALLTIAEGADSACDSAGASGSALLEAILEDADSDFTGLGFSSEGSCFREEACSCFDPGIVFSSAFTG